MCRLQNSYAWLPRKWLPDRQTHTQTDTRQSEPLYALQVTQKVSCIRKRCGLELTTLCWLQGEYSNTKLVLNKLPEPSQRELRAEICQGRRCLTTGPSPVPPGSPWPSSMAWLFQGQGLGPQTRGTPVKLSQGMWRLALSELKIDCSHELLLF